MSIVSWSLKAAGALRSWLSIRIATSALLRDGRVLEPEKITSSMEEARMDLYDDSPMTQRNASTRFDLPQPLGPTTPVRPGSIRKSVGSTNDLNPSRRSRVSFIDLVPHCVGAAVRRGQRRLFAGLCDGRISKFRPGLIPGRRGRTPHRPGE